MKLYPILKAFCLGVMLAAYILMLLTMVAAHSVGGVVAVAVDRYGEGMFEVALFSSLLPLNAYVVFKEVVEAAHAIRKNKK